MSAAHARAVRQRCRILSASLPAPYCGAQAPAQGADSARGWHGVSRRSALCGLRHLLLSFLCQSGGQGNSCIVHSVRGNMKTTARSICLQGKPKRELMLTFEADCRACSAWPL